MSNRKCWKTAILIKYIINGCPTLRRGPNIVATRFRPILFPKSDHIAKSINWIKEMNIKKTPNDIFVRFPSEVRRTDPTSPIRNAPRDAFAEKHILYSILFCLFLSLHLLSPTLLSLSSIILNIIK